MAGSGTTRSFGWAFGHRPMTAKGRLNGERAAPARTRCARCCPSSWARSRSGPGVLRPQGWRRQGVPGRARGVRPGSSAARSRSTRSGCWTRAPATGGWTSASTSRPGRERTSARSPATSGSGSGRRLPPRPAPDRGGWPVRRQRTLAGCARGAGRRRPAGRGPDPGRQVLTWTRSCSMRSRQDGSPTAPR